MIEARKPTGMRASRRAASRSERRTGASSTTGSVFGIATTATKPPAAARACRSRGPPCAPARDAQVHVRVDEAGEQVAALAVDHLGALGRLERAGRAELGDLAAAHEHVERRVDAGARVEHVGAADQQVGGRLLAVDERSSARGRGSRGCGSPGRTGLRPARRGRPAARRAPPSGRRRRPRPAGRSPPAASRSPRRRARRRG